MATVLSQKRVLVLVMVMLPTSCFSTDEYESSKATYYGSPYCQGFPIGACGYGLYSKTANEGNVVSVSKLFKNGTGCGACYQIKCKAPECSEEGVKVVATDHGFSFDVDFILGPRVYARMAQARKEMDLLSCEYVDVEYKRIPCKYTGKNLMLKVHEHSNFPHYLALVPLYQGGMYDITAVEIYEEETQQWKACRKAYGAVWDMVSPPKGALTVRFYTCAVGSTEGKWVVASNVIPAYWKAGLIMDTSVQLS